MPIEKTKSTDTVASGLIAKTGASERGGAGGVFTVTCFDKDGNLKWEEKTHNIVVNQGLQYMNTQFFKGVSYSAAWYVGLVNNSPTPSFSANDTLNSHGGWSESVAYAGNRKAAIFGTATTAGPSVISNSANTAQFVMNNTVTINGAFLCNVASGSLVTDVLFSVAAFQSPGNRSVVNGDTLNVTYQFSLDAA
jgi:hypothetical protein